VICAELPGFFDGRAVQYDEAHDRRDPDGHALRARLAVVLRLLGDGPANVLDAGMGPGRLLGELEVRGWSVAGIDASAEMVALARARLPDARERLLEGRIEKIPFGDASFDAVVATGVLEYVEDLAAALRELGRVARPGGLLVVSMPNRLAILRPWRRYIYRPLVRIAKRVLGRAAPPRRPGAVSLRMLHALLAASGARVETVEYAAFLPVPPPFDFLFPSSAVRLAEKLEGSDGCLGRALATQLVVAARKEPLGARAPSRLPPVARRAEADTVSERRSA
jgi:SAM-dependent methyltransferase